MPTSCSAPGCKINYKHDDRVTLFKMSRKPNQLRHAWVRALRSTTKPHVSSAKGHIQQAIDVIHLDSHLEPLECPELSQFQLILCQLENSLVPYKQILSLKTHLFSPACYKYVSPANALFIPSPLHTLDKLGSSFGLENKCFIISWISKGIRGNRHRRFRLGILFR